MNVIFYDQIKTFNNSNHDKASAIATWLIVMMWSTYVK